MKAKNYSDKVLLLPKEPLASMLFLEYLGDYNKLNKLPISFTIQDFDVWNKYLLAGFVIPVKLEDILVPKEKSSKISNGKKFNHQLHMYLFT